MKKESEGDGEYLDWASSLSSQERRESDLLHAPDFWDQLNELEAGLMTMANVPIKWWSITSQTEQGTSR